MHPDPNTAKVDIFAVLDTSPNEVPALLAALKEGRIDGSLYAGECCCLIGTIAAAAGVDWISIPERAPDDISFNKLMRCEASPAERWFLDIAEGETPAISERVALTVQWVEEWIAKRAD